LDGYGRISLTAIESEIIAKAELPILLKGVRKALKLSQQELAELSEISRQSICYYESGHVTPTMMSLKMWLDAVSREIKRRKTKGVRERSKKSRKKEIDNE